MIHTGDCIEVMRGMDAESVDSIVTDPPAGIAFMSKHWDRDKGGRTQWVAWMTDVMSECYRVLKPGGYAVVWSLPRTCHWTAWAMEDAGFIIRDQLAHIFASGFPKGKAQLKPAREDWWLTRKPGPLQPLQIDATRIPTSAEDQAIIASMGGYGREGYRRHMDTPALMMHGTERATPADASKGRWPSNLLLSDPQLFDEPNPYVVGSGATATSGVGEVGTGNGPTEVHGWGGTIRSSFGDSGGYSRFFIVPKADRGDREPIVAADTAPYEHSGPRGHTLNGDGTPRATSRPRANVHPTVKPIDLMRHLVRLVTPSGGTVLDPFLGSGSTAIACEMEGFPWIGIEREPEYVAIAEARLNGTQRGLGLDVPAPTSSYRPPAKMPKPKWTADTPGFTPNAHLGDEEPVA
jgi:hypothetical protein